MMEASAIMLIVQLWVGDKVHVLRGEMSTLEECHEVAKGAYAMRDYRGEPIKAILAGCYAPIQETPT